MAVAQETVVLQGHIIDSLILAKVLFLKIFIKISSWLGFWFFNCLVIIFLLAGILEMWSIIWLSGM